MRSIQQKLMLYIVIIGIVPMMFFTFYYYNFSRNSLLNRLEIESKGVLEQFDNKIIIKLNRIQNTVDILFKDKEFLRLLKETEKNSEDERLLNKKLDFIYVLIYKDLTSENEDGIVRLVWFEKIKTIGTIN